jgi:hypothetical protein
VEILTLLGCAPWIALSHKFDDILNSTAGLVENDKKLEKCMEKAMLKPQQGQLTPSVQWISMDDAVALARKYYHNEISTIIKDLSNIQQKVPPAKPAGEKEKGKKEKEPVPPETTAPVVKHVFSMPALAPVKPDELLQKKWDVKDGSVGIPIGSLLRGTPGPYDYEPLSKSKSLAVGMTAPMNNLVKETVLHLRGGGGKDIKTEYQSFYRRVRGASVAFEDVEIGNFLSKEGHESSFVRNFLYKFNKE